MDAKLIGATIAQLRRDHKYTQAELADLLNVSDKTVSRWESGSGYPEITQFPILAALFGVSIDYLMTGARNGITFAGSMVVDWVKTLPVFPERGMLSYIASVTKAVGGCACNTAIDLAKIDRSVPISVMGCVGDDDSGRFLLQMLRKHYINTDMVQVLENTQTAFCDVMSEPGRERTFFSFRGANARFCPGKAEAAQLKCRMLHIGYLLLLDALDAPDPEFGTAMARFLYYVKERGIKTSIDLVSDSSADYAATVLPALKYTDYAIINEIECCKIFEWEPRHPDGSLNIPVIRLAMEKLLEAGVREKVIVHCPEASFCLSAGGSFTKLGSLRIRTELIAGSVGAGDAFCAGCLYGIYNDYTDLQMLEFASAAAASSLFAVNSIDGMRPRDALMELAEEYGRLQI